MTALKPVLKNQQGRHPDWMSVYRPETYKELPWYSQHLDSCLQEFFSATYPDHPLTILDVGTGDGTQAWELARRGHQVTGIDIAPGAIELCHRFSSENLTFLVADVLEFATGATFDYVIDRGCMHVLPASRLQHYSRCIHQLLKPGGKLLLNCFGDRSSDTGIGPNRFDKECLEQIFSESFKIISARPVEFSGPRTQKPKTLFSILERL